MPGNESIEMFTSTEFDYKTGIYNQSVVTLTEYFIAGLFRYIRNTSLKVLTTGNYF